MLEVFDFSSSDFDGEVGLAALALNKAHEVELSPLSLDRLRALALQAFFACRVGLVDAFVIALDQGADYQSPNFLWFRDRFDRFVYVDRIVVAQSARGRGLARKLYERLFDAARKAGHFQIVCEVNYSPPNPKSDAFHRGMGFVEVGLGVADNGAKTVRYLRLALDPQSSDAV